MLNFGADKVEILYIFWFGNEANSMYVHMYNEFRMYT